MSGRIVSRDDLGNVQPLVGYRVAVMGPPPLFGGGEIDDDVTDGDGRFNLTYLSDSSKVGRHSWSQRCTCSRAAAGS